MRLRATLRAGFEFLISSRLSLELPIEFRLDVVLDPFLVPPLDRQDGDAVQVNAEVKVVAHGKPGFAGFADELLLLDLIAHFDVDGAQVRVEGEKTEAVIDDDRVAVDSQIADESDDAAVGGFGGVMLGDR